MAAGIKFALGTRLGIRSPGAQQRKEGHSRATEKKRSSSTQESQESPYVRWELPHRRSAIIVESRSTPILKHFTTLQWNKVIVVFGRQPPWPLQGLGACPPSLSSFAPSLPGFTSPPKAEQSSSGGARRARGVCMGVCGRISVFSLEGFQTSLTVHQQNTHTEDQVVGCCSLVVGWRPSTCGLLVFSSPLKAKQTPPVLRKNVCAGLCNDHARASAIVENDEGNTLFIPIVLTSCGGFGPSARAFLKEVFKTAQANGRGAMASGQPEVLTTWNTFNASTYWNMRLSVAGAVMDAHVQNDILLRDRTHYLVVVGRQPHPNPNHSSYSSVRRPRRGVTATPLGAV
jgi:hypothetical protein